MATTYIDLCNKVLRQLNEVELQSANFSGTGGFHASVRDAVNYAIRDINQAEFQWPFNHVATSVVLTPGTQSYDLPSDFKVVDWDTFFLKPDTSLKTYGRPLELCPYDVWHDRYRVSDQEFEGEPYTVIPGQGDNFIISPSPDKAYTIEYEYWKFGQELVNASDVPNIPERFQNVIVEGALAWAYRFRDNHEQRATMEKQFQKSIKEMRTILINKYQRVYVNRPTMASRWNRFN